MKKTDFDLHRMAQKILRSKKYRDTGLNPDTLMDLLQQEAAHQNSEKALQKSVRRKLHNILAPYLGEPDYESFSKRLSELIDFGLESKQIREFCLDILKEHASTAERIDHHTAFYQRLFEATGQPASILDLACGHHPFAFPWMGLPTSTAYHAYDILQPRVDLINQFFRVIGLAPLAEDRDILIHPPTIQADLGIFFKEAHRFEKRQPGCNRSFWSALCVKTLAVSLPAHDLSGTHSLLERHRDLVYRNLPVDQPVQELVINDEIIFLIDQPGQ
jgi:16S rRNA (guanine(1405)-N(7))-methyltransferase